jgi:hypothetical protein
MCAGETPAFPGSSQSILSGKFKFLITLNRGAAAAGALRKLSLKCGSKLPLFERSKLAHSKESLRRRGSVVNFKAAI